MKIRTLAIAALALVLPLTAAACGGKDDSDSGKRPSVDEIVTAMKKEIPGASEADAEVQCIGQKLHESDLPNGVLRALVDGREAEINKDNEDKYTKMITDSMGECVAEAMEDMEIPEVPESAPDQ